jgi:YesN/AraC family two-component response regulator
MDHSLKILIIDDEEPILSNPCYFLKYKNYDVISAPDGLEGLKLFEKDPKGFDLIITDIVMPKMSGMSFISIIKKKSPNTPTIAITG